MADEEKQTGGALAKFMGGGALSVSKEEMAAALSESAQDGTTGSGDAVYLTFSGQGANYAGWKLGRDKEKPPVDALYVGDPMSCVEGWTCWKGGAPVGKHEWSVYSRKTQAVPQSALEDHGPYADGDGWQFMMGMSMFDIDNPGQQITFTTTSKSGRNALGDLTKEIAKRLVNEEPYVPVFSLDSESFQAHGKTNGKPKFAVEGWVTSEEVMAFIEAGDDGDLEDLLSGAYAQGGEEEAAPEPEEKPKRRSARRSAA